MQAHKLPIGPIPAGACGPIPAAVPAVAAAVGGGDGGCSAIIE